MYHGKLWKVELGESRGIYKCLDVTETIYNIY